MTRRLATRLVSESSIAGKVIMNQGNMREGTLWLPPHARRALPALAVIGGITACCPVQCGKAAQQQEQAQARSRLPPFIVAYFMAVGEPVGRAVHVVEHVGTKITLDSRRVVLRHGSAGVTLTSTRQR